MRRVVVTGLGIASALGSDVEIVWQRLLAGKSGISSISHFPTDDLPSRIAGLVPSTEEDEQAGFDVARVAGFRLARRIDRFILYALHAGSEAVSDSGWSPSDGEDMARTGVILGSGIGGLETIASELEILRTRGPRRVSPFFVPSSLVNLAAGHLSIRHGFRGPGNAPATACATGAHAIGDARRMILSDEADVILTGGAEAAVCRLGVAGFAAARALSTHYNDRPSEASRPWDRGRDGFVMSEGSGVLMLEELEHAKRRDARIYGEVLGCGLSSDAYHITKPCPDGRGAKQAMQAALASARCNPEQIDYINAHGTSTPAGDEVEFCAVGSIFGGRRDLLMSSTKSSIGHTLGASGAIEAIFSLLALRDGVAPPTLNLEDVSPGCVGIDLVPKQARRHSMDYVLSNSFGFGGTNASLVFARFS